MTTTKQKTPAQPLDLDVAPDMRVSALLQRPADASALYVFAHGAGAGMTHRFMVAVADGLADRRIATLRYQFPYMQRGSRRPDAPALAHATVRAAVAHAATLDLPLVAGGKSFGGRMTSQAQAVEPLLGVRGLAFVGFPLHPSGKPAVERAAHLDEVRLPMLFLQGTRDELADLAWLKPVVQRLGGHATLRTFEAADHSFHVPARSERSDAETLGDLIDALAAWIAHVCASLKRR
jgi:predicted alpha/beta-hydrolase family hydrolase